MIHNNIVKTILDSFDDIAFVKDTKSIYQLVNAKFCNRFKIKEQHIIGKDDSALFSHNEATTSQNEDKEVILSKVSFTTENTRIVNGQKLQYRIKKTPLIDESGNVYGIYGVVTDLSDSQLTEQVKRLSILKEKLLATGSLQEKMQLVTEDVVNIFEADFCRVWIIDKGDLCDLNCSHSQVTNGLTTCTNRNQCLHLVASAGKYTSLTGGHQRVPFGAYKIGLIASGVYGDFLTNDVAHDPRIHQHDWARKNKLVSFAGSRLLSATGKPIGVLALFSKKEISTDEHALLKDVANVTALVIQTVRAEEKLQENKNFIEKIFENIPAMIFVKDAKDLRFVKLNKGGEELLGYSRDELLGKNDHDFFGKESADFFTKIDRKVLTTGKGIEIAEECVQTKSKGERILHTKKIPILNNDGVPKYLLGISADITEKKQIEKALHDSENKYRTLFDSSADAISIIDVATGSFIDCNDAAIHLHNKSQREEIIGFTPTDFSPQFQPHNILSSDLVKTYIQATSKEGFQEFEWIYGKTDKSSFHALVTLSPMRMKERQCILVIEKDITERKRVANEREQLINELREALDNVQTLSGLIPICSHCKKIRDDKGYWNQIESYIQQHSTAQFSHSLCTECSDELYGNEDWYTDMKNEEAVEKNTKV